MRLPNAYTSGEAVCVWHEGENEGAGTDVWGKPLPSPPADQPEVATGLRVEDGAIVA